MKKHFLIPVFLFLTFCLYSQVGFEKNIIIGPDDGPRNPVKYIAGDIDNDGDEDLLYSSHGDYKIAWIKNINSTGKYEGEILIDNFGDYYVNSMVLIDIDQDSDLDLIVSHSEGDIISWYENIDGSFSNVSQSILNYNNVSMILFGDMDGDNFDDLVVVSKLNNSISWFANLNNDGTFGTENIISDNAIKCDFTNVADVDNDGDFDIITSVNNKIVWYENANGTFSTEKLIVNVNLSFFARPIFVEDLDNDGDLDVLSIKYISFSDYRVVWQENIDGLGNFEEHILNISFYDEYISLSAGDVDGDGDFDVIVANPYNASAMSYYLNAGNNFDTFIENEVYIYDNGFNIFDLLLSDINNDGVKNVIVGFGEEYKISWFEYKDFDEMFHQNIITKSATHVEKVLAADLDSDGDLDIISGDRADGRIAWYENVDGLGTMGHQQIIETNLVNFPYIGDIQIGDLDNDGDNDVIVAYWGPSVTNKVFWYENLNGLGEFSSSILIDGGYYGSRSLCISDIDNDGDLDIISAKVEQDNNGIVLYNNNGSGNFGAPIIISDEVSTPKSVTASDIDGDGDIDIISTNDNKVSWYENIDGLGGFGAQQIVSSVLSHVYSAQPCDIDGDGDTDLVAASYSDKKIVWYENMDGLGSFSDEHIIFISEFTIQDLDISDIDGDGDFDIVTSASNDAVWIENLNGLGEFGVAQITDPSSHVTSIFTADIDNDNTQDILCGYFNGDEIFWYRNLGVIKNEIKGTVKYDLNNNGCDDLDVNIWNQNVKSTSSNEELSVLTNYNGIFQLFPEEGTFETELMNLAEYFTYTPEIVTSTFNGIGLIDTFNFCVTALQSIADLETVILPLVPAVPGFKASYRVVLKNNGTDSANGIVSFEFNDASLDLFSSSYAINSQIENYLTFEVLEINPFETKTIDLVFNVMEPPIVNNDDTLLFAATINPIIGDYNEDDNTFNLDQIVIGAFDPNDITCLEGNAINITDIDKYLHYMIRFQNTGTASATNVRVENELDDKLDWSTFQLISSSHMDRVEINDGNQVSFIFDNIFLPDSTANEELSHGFVAYKIRPKSDVNVGDIFASTADIYFDFNEPVITNTALTEIVDIVSTDVINTLDFNVYPVPVVDLLNIEVKGEVSAIKIYNQLGQLVLSNENQNNIKVTSLSSGVYTIKVKTQNGEEGIRNIVKE